MRDLVGQVGKLLEAGKARAWGVLNYPPALLKEAVDAAHAAGVPPPSAAQLAYSLAQKSGVEDRALEATLRKAGTDVVASYVLQGGTLTGKYADPDARGRMAGRLDNARSQAGLALAPTLGAFARRVGTAPAAVAIAFALLNPLVATVLFGATSPAQLAENLSALEVLDRLDEQTAAELRSLA